MKQLIGLLWAIVICAIISLFFCTCTTTKYVTVPEYHTDTLYKARKDSIKWNIYTHIKDSVSLRDSVVLKVNDKGEVVGKDTWHWRERYRNEKDSTDYYKSKADSALNSRRDSIRVPYPVTKEVIKHDMYAYQKFFMWVGIIGISGIIAYCIWRIKRKV